MRGSEYATTRKAGACNELQGGDPSTSIVSYCQRPAGADGLCNVHRAAKERGRKQREWAARRAYLLARR